MIELDPALPRTKSREVAYGLRDPEFEPRSDNGIISPKISQEAVANLSRLSTM